MMLFDGRLPRNVDPAEFQALLGTTEDTLLDFKQQPYGTLASDEHEMLKDIAAFANTDGGYLLVGVIEQDSKAIDFQSVPNAEVECERMLQLCRRQIVPVIPGLEIVPVILPRGETIIVAYVPASEIKPHMVLFGQRTYFYKRYPPHHNEYMRYDEIRAAFNNDLQGRLIDQLTRRIDYLERTMETVVTLLEELRTHLTRG